MALPTNIFLGKAKAPTPQTKKQFSTHKPWDQPVSSAVGSVDNLDLPVSELVTHTLTAVADDSNLCSTSVQPDQEVSTNPEQSQYKLSTKTSTNPVQSQYKLSTNGKTRPTPPLETQYKVSTQPSTQVRTKSVQTQNKVSTNLPFSSIVGLQRRIILYVFDASKTSREKLTAPIALKNLAEACETTPMAAQGSTRRLEQKKLLRRGEYKNGRGGWTRYELPNELFQELLQLETQNKVSTNPEQSQYKVRTQPSTQPSTSPSSSSSSLYLEEFKTTTTGEPELLKSDSVQLSPEWQTVDWSSLVEIGFTETHLVQVVRQGKLSTEEVQDSIHFFAFDLKRNGKGTAIHGSPLNFFMGILRRGQAYAPPENYESPAAEARRKYLEGKRSLEARRIAEEAELQTLEFNQWKRGLSESDIVALVPEFARQRPGQIQDAALLAHFEKEIWPTKKQDFLMIHSITGTVNIQSSCESTTEIKKLIDESLKEVHS